MSQSTFDSMMTSNNESNIAHGGKTVFGASVGILMLDTRFPRIPGDIGHAGTWPFPVLFRVVRGASPDLVVRRRAEGMLQPFIDAGRELVADGADGITTNCGFLSLFQDELSRELEVPVATSSLMQWHAIRQLLPPGKVPGIVTISAASLSREHLDACGIPQDAPTTGTDEGEEFTRALLNNEATLNVDLAAADVLGAARELVRKHPQVGAILLECTNMVPYAALLREKLGMPVFSIYTFVQWFQAGLLPRHFEGSLQDPRHR